MTTLVDTSVWIEFLRGNSPPQVTLLEALLEEGEASLCEVVYAEILFGARSDKQFEKYADYLSNLPFLSLESGWHLEAARMGYLLRTKGFRPFLADLQIAYAALSHKVPLLTMDQDFRPYADLFGLVLE